MSQIEFDFREDLDVPGEIQSEIDSMNIRELKKLKETIQPIKDSCSHETLDEKVANFKETIIPWMKSYTEEQAAFLKIDEELPGLISMTLRGSALVFDRKSRGIWMSLISADHISIENDSDEIMISLIYDFAREIKES